MNVKLMRFENENFKMVKQKALHLVFDNLKILSTLTISIVHPVAVYPQSNDSNWPK